MIVENPGGMSGPATTVATLFALPDNALASIALRLPLESLISFARTCRSAKDMALVDTQFQARLIKDYNVRIEALPDGASFAGIYRQLHTQLAQDQTLRFQAVSTDGGVDTSATRRLVFWVDNMYAAGTDGSYCSEIGKPMTTFGVFSADEPEQDVDLKQRTMLARLLLEKPLEMFLHLEEEHPLRRPLDLWCISELENFVSELWGSDLEACEPRLRNSFESVARQLGETPTAIEERTRRLVHVFRLMVRADPSVPEIYPWPEQNRKSPVHLWHPHFSVVADPRNPKLLYDAKLMPRLLRPPLHLPHPLAVVTKIRVSRKGEFSCPVRTGAVLAGLHLKSIRNTRGSGTLSSEMEPFGSVRSSSLPWPNAAPDAMPTGSVVVPGSACLSESAHESSLAERSSTCHSSLAEDTVVDVGHVRNALVDLTPAAARRLHHCTSFVTLEDMVARDLLPAILQVHVHRVRSHFCGVTVEFEPSGEGCAEGLSPIIWFQFFDEQEDRFLQAWEAGASQQGESGSAAVPLPSALQWVAQIYKPAHGAAAISPTAQAGPSSAADPNVPPTATYSNPGAGDGPCYGGQADSADSAGPEAAPTDSDEEVEAGSHPRERAGMGTHGRNKFKLSLARKRTCNVVSVLLLDQENLMELWDDGHDEPNIDISRITFHGPSVQVPGNTKFADSP